MDNGDIMGSQELGDPMFFSSQEMRAISDIINFPNIILEDPLVDALSMPELIIPKLEGQTTVTSNEDYSMPLPAITPPKQPSVISTEDYSGPYNFEAFIDPHVTKSPWVYSAVLNKVYIPPQNSFPVDFMWSQDPSPEAFIVRAMALYSQPSEAHKPVERCFNHYHENDKTNKGLSPHIWKHVIRVINNRASYMGEKGEHLSVTVPLERPQTGSDSIRQMYEFVCQNSCPSGMNRRPIEVVFTLEDQGGHVYGRKSVSVRVCSCPKRDKEKEEGEHSGKTGCSRQPQGKRRKTNHPTEKKQSSFSDAHQDTKEYELRVKVAGKHNVKAVLKYCHDLMAGELSRHGTEEPYKKLMKEHLHAMKNLPE